MKKDLTKYYPKLTPRERVKLAIAAMARNDDEEIKLLTKTCPTENYVVTDPAYIDRVELTKDLSVAFSLELARLLAGIRMVDTLSIVFEHYRRREVDSAIGAYCSGLQRGADWAWEAAGKGKEYPWPEGVTQEKLVEEMEKKVESEADRSKQAFHEVRAALAGEVKALWEVFEAVCGEQFEIDPEILLKAWLPPAEAWLEEIKRCLTGDTEVNSESKEETRALVDKLLEQRMRSYIWND